MRVFEIAMAAVLGALGVRSLLHWVQRPFDSTDPRDHLLYSAFVIGRAGLWWSLGGFFAISASIRNPDPQGSGAFLAGRAFRDELAARFWWYPLIVLGFTALQFVPGYFLGRRAPPAEGRRDRSGAPVSDASGKM